MVVSNSLILPIDGASFLDWLLPERAVNALRQVCGYDDEVQEDICQRFPVNHHLIAALVHLFSPPGRSGLVFAPHTA